MTSIKLTFSKMCPYSLIKNFEENEQYEEIIFITDYFRFSKNDSSFVVLNNHERLKSFTLVIKNESYLRIGFSDMENLKTLSIFGANLIYNSTKLTSEKFDSLENLNLSQGNNVFNYLSSMKDFKKVFPKVTNLRYLIDSKQNVHPDRYYPLIKYNFKMSELPRFFYLFKNDLNSNIHVSVSDFYDEKIYLYTQNTTQPIICNFHITNLHILIVSSPIDSIIQIKTPVSLCEDGFLAFFELFINIKLLDGEKNLDANFQNISEKLKYDKISMCYINILKYQEQKYDPTFYPYVLKYEEQKYAHYESRHISRPVRQD